MIQSITRPFHIRKGRIPRDESVVISITGNGYKTLEAVASKVEQPYTVKANVGKIPISSINI